MYAAGPSRYQDQYSGQSSLPPNRPVTPPNRNLTLPNRDLMLPNRPVTPPNRPITPTRQQQLLFFAKQDSSNQPGNIHDQVGAVEYNSVTGQPTSNNGRISRQQIQTIAQKNVMPTMNGNQIGIRAKQGQADLNVSRISNLPFNLANVNEDLSSKSTFSSCSRFFHICLVFFYGLGALIATSILIRSYPEASSSRTQLDQTLENWSQFAISSISVITLSAAEVTAQTFKTCPSGSVTMFTFKGQKLLDGCNCLTPSVSTQIVDIFVGKCTSLQITNGCTNIIGINYPTGYNWITPSSNVFAICMTKMRGVTYMSNGSSTTCAKQCGGTTTSTIFCVDATQSCPINFVSFGLASTPPTITGAIINEITIDGVYSFYVSSTGPDLPIVDVAITKGIGECLDNTINNLYTTSNIYKLLDQSVTQVCSAIDGRYSQIMTMTESNALSSNYMTAMYTAIPNYVISTTETYGFYVRRMIGIEGSRRSTDLQIVVDIKNNYSGVHSATVSVMTTTCIYFIVVSICYSIVSLLSILDKKYQLKQFLYEIENKEIIDEKKKKNVFCRVSVKIFFTFVHLCSLIAAVAVTLTYFTEIRRLSGGTTVLGDTYLVGMINGLDSEFSTKILWYIVYDGIAFLVLVILESVFLVCLCSHKLREKTKVVIEKKYLSKAKNQQNNNDNAGGANSPHSHIEMQDYQTMNVYAGNGINTTIMPLQSTLAAQPLDLSYNMSRSNIRNYQTNSPSGSQIRAQQKQRGGYNEAADEGYATNIIQTSIMQASRQPQNEYEEFQRKTSNIDNNRRQYESNNSNNLNSQQPINIVSSYQSKDKVFNQHPRVLSESFLEKSEELQRQLTPSKVKQQLNGGLLSQKNTGIPSNNQNLKQQLLEQQIQQQEQQLKAQQHELMLLRQASQFGKQQTDELSAIDHQGAVDDQQSIDLDFNTNEVFYHHQPKTMKGTQIMMNKQKEGPFERPSELSEALNGRRSDQPTNQERDVLKNQFGEYKADKRQQSSVRQQVNQLIGGSGNSQIQPQMNQQVTRTGGYTSNGSQFDSEVARRTPASVQLQIGGPGQINRRQIDANDQEVEDFNENEDDDVEDEDDDDDQDIKLPTYQQQFK